MSWLIKGVNHTIENNSWTTTIESLSIPKTVTKPVPNDFRVTNIITPTIYTPISTDGFDQNRIKTAIQFFRSAQLFKGPIIEKFTDIQIAGIIGNLLFESRLNPSATNGNTIGIAQWLGSRKQNLLKKSNYSTLKVQLEFIIEELNNSEASAKNYLLKAKDVKDAAITFDDKYERSERTNFKERVGYALDIYNKIQQGKYN
jgi:hypothetical protein